MALAGNHRFRLAVTLMQSIQMMHVADIPALARRSAFAYTAQGT